MGVGGTVVFAKNGRGGGEKSIAAKDGRVLNIPNKHSNCNYTNSLKYSTIYVV